MNGKNGGASGDSSGEHSLKITIEGAKTFFAKELQMAMENQKISAQKESFDYIVALLLRFMHSEHFFSTGQDGKPKHQVLFDLYTQYLHGTQEAKVVALKKLGDLCLVVSGVFPDSLKRKLVDLDYYYGMGVSAYERLSKIQFSDLGKKVFSEMSQKFVPFSNVLSYLSEKHRLQNNTDLLRLYEKWLLSGSDHVKKLLENKGIQFPIRTNHKQKH